MSEPLTHEQLEARRKAFEAEIERWRPVFQEAIRILDIEFSKFVEAMRLFGEAFHANHPVGNLVEQAVAAPKEGYAEENAPTWQMLATQEKSLAASVERAITAPEQGDKEARDDETLS